MKNYIMFLAFVLINFCSIYAQELPKTNQVQLDTNIGKDVFINVEVMPEFPGGENARQLYLVQNIKYPAIAKKNNIQGTVFATFVVEKDGSMSNIKISKGIGSGCDEEVIRVISTMPKWSPGSQRGNAVRVLINLPVKFSLK